jgi:hypothetical protein
MSVIESIPIFREILDERMRQWDKWGEQNHPDEWYAHIMYEEMGELSKAMLEAHFEQDYPGAYPDADPANIRKELIEAVAVGVAWLECIDRRSR